MAENAVQRWDLTVRGRSHRVEVEGSITRTVRWYVDGDLVASKRTSDDTVQLSADPDIGEAIGVKFSALGRPKRVTLFEAGGDTTAKARAAVGIGGIDLDPEPGSPAALREQRIREHPWRHATIATAGGVAKVVIPLLLGALAVRFVVNLPWPSWDIPWPDIDLPRIPWPEIPWPRITWPRIDLPDWQLPGWVRWVAERLEYVGPIVIAFVLARAEVNRRRKQDALKDELRAASNPVHDADERGAGAEGRSARDPDAPDRDGPPAHGRDAADGP